MSFAKRQIEATITLGTGNFGGSGSSNTAILTGHRISCQIVKACAPGFDTANIRIWGLTPDVMNAVSRLGKPLTLTRNNTIVIKAGDADSGMALVFQGVIQNASQDWLDAPNVSLTIGAQAGAISQMAPVQPTSFQGQADVATLLTTIAGMMKPPHTLENNGVSVTLPNPYYSGTATDQLFAVVEDAGIYCTIDDENNTVAIWPKNGSRSGDPFAISLETGLWGYPTFADAGIELRTLFKPGIRVGGQVQVTSISAPSVNGTWRVMSLQYDLEAEMPGGAWYQELVCTNPNTGQPT